MKIWTEGESLYIDGNGWEGLTAPENIIDCGNSGTTMRLLSGVLAGRPFTTIVDGDESLRRRPMQRVIEPLSRMGAHLWAGKAKDWHRLRLTEASLKASSIRCRLPALR